MAEPNERPAQTKDTSRPTNNRLEGASAGEVREAPESRVASTSTGIGSDTVQSGSEAAGGSVVDKRAPDAKRKAEREGSPEAIGDRLRDADG